MTAVDFTKAYSTSFDKSVQRVEARRGSDERDRRYICRACYRTDVCVCLRHSPMDIPNLRRICRSIPLPNFSTTLSSFRVVVIFLSPFVRRVVDYHLSWNWANPINLSPLLAAVVCIASVRFAARKGNELKFFPLILIAMGVAFGYIIGLQNVGFVSASYAAFNWLIPPLLCFHIACHHEYFLELRDALIKTFVWGGLITGLYGIFQYFYLPPWDAEWIIRSQIFGQIGSTNLPYAQYVRVFSTMNSPVPFASAMMASIIIALNAQHRLRWVAAPPALTALLLSIARTAWGGLGVAWLYTIVRLRTSATLQQLVVAACVLFLALPLLSIDSVSSIVSKRFDTFLKLTDDSSYAARAELYQNALIAVSSNFAGNGTRRHWHRNKVH